AFGALVQSQVVLAPREALEPLGRAQGRLGNGSDLNEFEHRGLLSGAVDGCELGARDPHPLLEPLAETPGPSVRIGGRRCRGFRVRAGSGWGGSLHRWRLRST